MKKTKIKLIMAPRFFSGEARGMLSIPPLGIAHLASFLRKRGYRVDLDDLDIKLISDKKLFNRVLELQKLYTQKELDDYLISNKPHPVLSELTSILLNKTAYQDYDLIGFSINESIAIDPTLLLSKRIKEETGCQIALGGYCAESSLKSFDFIDYVVTGPGEGPLLDIIGASKNKKTRQGKEIWIRQMPDFRGLPLSHYRDIINKGDFRNSGRILLLPYIWSWGCLYKCSFCGNSASGLPRIFLKPVSRTVQELEEFCSKYKTKCFFVLNEYIHTDKGYTVRLCRELIRQKADILWCGSARCNIEPKLLPLIYKAGGFYLTFGLESGSDKILKSMRKGFNRLVSQKTIRRAHNFGIWTAVNIMTGFPHETDGDFEASFDFVHQNINYLDQLNAGGFRLRQSAVMQNPESFGVKIRRRGRSEKHSSSRIFAYDEINGPKWEELEEIKYQRLRKLYKLFYLYKKLPDYFLKASTYQLFHFADKSGGNKNIYQALKDEYRKTRKQDEFVLAITDQCNNHCSFCKRPQKIFSQIKQIEEQLELLKKQGIKKIIISGGEPTMHPLFFDIVELVKSKGYGMELYTNGRMFAYPQFCQKLFDRGLQQASVTLYSRQADIHDTVTGVPGSFGQTTAGIGNWRKLKGAVKIRTLPLRQNRENMSQFIDYILALETKPVF